MNDKLAHIADLLEVAPVGNEEFDVEIVAALNNAIVRRYPPTDDFGPKNRWQFWSLDGAHFLGNESRFKVLPFTTCMNTVHAFIRKELPDYVWTLSTVGSRPLAEFWSASPPVEATGATPELAFAAAALRAYSKRRTKP